MKSLTHKTYFFLLIFFFMGFTSFAQETSLLWKISGNGLSKESYLFGTIHIICAEDFLMDSRIEAALAHSEGLLLELDLSDPQMAMKMQQQSLNEGMKNIQSELTKEDTELLDRFFTENYGAGIAQLGILKPFVLSSMALLKSIPCEDVKSYETFFMEKAKAQTKSIEGLETVELQMGIFDQIPAAVQLEELVKMIKEESGADEFRKLVSTYLTEDIQGLFDVMNADGMMNNYRNILLDNRNKNWIPILQEKMKQKSQFIAVGGGHLGGEIGVVELLRKAGFTVTPILP